MSLGDANTEFRKLAAIMFTDMVGYSALAQRNEALALELLEEHRRILRGALPSHSGREVKTTGDGFLLEFKSALAAVECAVQMQRMLRDRNAGCAEERAVRVRIGIHVGDVVMRDGDIHGDGVNIASRIEPLAAAGGICVSEDVKRQVQNKVAQMFTKIGTTQLKNIHAPMEIYQIELEEAGIVAGEGRSGRQPPAGQKSIAVLPFANMSSDRENEYLSDGITEDLITALSQISGLRVPARTSSFAFKGKNEDIRVIGEKLSVTTALEGSVRKSGNRLRITAQLINVADGYHLWSEKYDREMEDVFAIQDEITRAIVTALKVQLGGGPETPLVKPATASMEAYQLYLRGREYWSQRGTGLKKALHFFELALLEDPSYALAYSGKADALVSLTFYGYGAPGDLIPKAKAAAAKALELEPALAEAHLSLATIQSWHDWDFGQAEKSYRRALNFKPNSSLAHSFFATHLCGEGRIEESIKEARIAADLDPISAFSNAFLGWMHAWSRQHSEARPHLEKSLQLAPNFALAHWILGQNYAAEGRHREAIGSFERAGAMSGNAPWALATLAQALGASGQREKALALLAELEDPSRQPFVRHFYGALIYGTLGETELALDRLEKSFEQRDVWLRWLWSHRAFDGLHAERRFLEITRKIGLREAL